MESPNPQPLTPNPLIVGIGIDLIEVERIQRAVDHPQWGERFRRRVYTPGEIAYCLGKRRYVESFATRFAAKEAVMKALGRGFGDGINWCEIEVVRASGPPSIVLHGSAAECATRLGIDRWHLSLTHTSTAAMAYVIAESASAAR
jgi:holo-[acyl-carrier protein] synthase